MLSVVRASWPLFLGFALLMVGNALQATLLGVRSVIEGFSIEVFGYVTAAFFAGFLGGSWFTPILLRRVGHIRVFAALASLISAAFILYAAVVDPIAWIVLRMVVGFGFAGVYVVCESWINDVSTNENRGQALSAYMLTQWLAVVAGPLLLNVADPAGYDLFVLISVLVSISFAPILLSVAPAPVFQTSKAMTFRELFEVSPLGFVGALLIGGVVGVMFGMTGLYAKLIGMTDAELTVFVTVVFAGALLSQAPIGWLSDRMDRRRLIIILAIAGAAACLVASTSGRDVLFEVGGLRIFSVIVPAFAVGALLNPLYGLVIAHTNDFVENEKMASAASALVFLNGVGALGGPIIVGYLMAARPEGFWSLLGLLSLLIAIYGVYRATQRPAVAVEETAPYATIGPRMTPIAAEMIQEMTIEQMEQEEAEADQDDAEADAEPWVARK